MMSAKFAEYCYNGLWYAPEMELVMNTVKLSQKHVKGEVFLTLYKGEDYAFHLYIECFFGILNRHVCMN